MTPTLDNLLNDCRLARLFSSESHPCALQLWVLQLKSEKLTENRILYGRLLPYNHANNTWFFSDNNNYLSFGQTKAQINRLNLYIESSCCFELITQLSNGKTISEISDALHLECSKKLRKKFGSTRLENDNLAYRPVAYLLNRDAHNRQSISSPHGSAGAFSASITRIDKGELFRLGEGYDASLAEMIVNHLNVETGLNFGGIDITRFGDLELMVFPALSDSEQPLLWVEWVGSQPILSARFNPKQVAHFDEFQFHLKITNDGQVIYSTVLPANLNGDGEVECLFKLESGLRKITDSTELEIFGFKRDRTDEGILCCSWQVGYIREINFQGHLLGQTGSPVKFDWLENTTRPTMTERVKAALTINHGNSVFTNHIGGRILDSWVPANNEIRSLFSRLHPPKSEGQFFQRFNMGDGEGRLKFVEWFKKQFSKYQQHQIVIFDPYFEDAGLGLLLLCAQNTSDYIVFTSLPKSSKDTEGSQITSIRQNHTRFCTLVSGHKKLKTLIKYIENIYDSVYFACIKFLTIIKSPSEKNGHNNVKFDKVASSRINNLAVSCELNRGLLKGVKLRIYGIKESKLHDRYILIMGQDSLPVAGFHLSNSFQKAAENYPLLITPIPNDVLFQVEKYKSALVKEAMAASSCLGGDNATMRLIFDSTVSTVTPRRYEPLSFLENSEAGNVLSAWSGELSLKGLSGSQLRAHMTVLGLLKDDSLMLSNGLMNCINQQARDIHHFTKVWEVLGEVLANSSTDDRWGQELASENNFLNYLYQFLEASFERAHDNVDKELAVIDVRFFRNSIEELLHSSYRIEHMRHPIKYTALTWAEYFAIKILWWHTPGDLLKIAEGKVLTLQIESNEIDAVRLSLLSQIVNEISLSIQFGIDDNQQDRLLHSSLDIFKWMGLSALKLQIATSDGLRYVFSLLETFNFSEKVQALGWMINHAARSSDQAESFNCLVKALHEIVPRTVNSDELKCLINSMRGHMKQLAFAEPWLFQDVINPLLQSKRATYDDACEIWMQELESMLGPQSKNQSRLFERSREGQTTNIAAFLFANSSPQRREASVMMMGHILNRQKRIVYQPLASTSNWTQWDDALTVSLWILTFTRWSEFYLHQCRIADEQLLLLARSAREIAMVRSLDEWKAAEIGKSSGLIACLKQVEALLSKENLQQGGHS